jgi:hypothetical protein
MTVLSIALLIYLLGVVVVFVSGIWWAKSKIKNPLLLGFIAVTSLASWVFVIWGVYVSLTTKETL